MDWWSVAVICSQWIGVAVVVGVINMALKEFKETIEALSGVKIKDPKPKRNPEIDPSDCELNHQINRGIG